MIDALIAIGVLGFGCIGIFLMVYLANHQNEKEIPNLNENFLNIYISKIQNGSKLTIGKDNFTIIIKVGQHFSWFQKKMWKFLLGIKVEDYSEED